MRSSWSAERSAPASSNASCALATGSSSSITRAPVEARTLRSLGLSPDGAEASRRSADDGGGLALKGCRRPRARGPVDRVLEHARDRRVVLGRRDQQCVGVGDRAAQRGHRWRREVAVVVFVVGRDRLEAVPDLDLDARRRPLRDVAEQARVVRVGAQAAGDGEDPHRDQLRSNSSVTRRRTSLASASAAAGQLHLPDHAERGAVDRRFQVESELLASAGKSDGTAQTARRLDGHGEAGHLELTVDPDRVGVARDLGRVEADLRVALGIEEVRREQMRADVLVVDRDRVDCDAALERDLAARDDELGVDGLEGAAKDGDACVVDFEVGVGVDRVDRPRAVCDLNVAERCCSHLAAPLLRLGPGVVATTIVAVAIDYYRYRCSVNSRVAK